MDVMQEWDVKCVGNVMTSGDVRLSCIRNGIKGREHVVEPQLPQPRKTEIICHVATPQGVNHGPTGKINERT